MLDALRRKHNAILVLFFVSGFGGLIYEAIWAHYLKLFLGHAAYAQTLVLVVFIGGLALGAWLCSRVAERLRNPLRLYAMVEGLIGLVSLVFHRLFVAATDWGYASLLPAACDQASAFCVPQWLLAALLLAPQSVLLGATFPLVSSALLRIDNSRPGHDVAALYFVNSLGAVFGVLAAAFVLIPAAGLPGTLTFAGSANLLLALAAFLLSREAPTALDIAPVAPTSAEASGSDRRLLQLLLATAFLTGLSSFIYEIAWIRMLSLVLGASTHSFELMLASFILGLALGGAWVRNRVDRVGDTVRFLASVQIMMGVAAAATLPIYSSSFDLMAWILSAVSRNSGGFLLFSVTSTAIALAVMLPATFCAGMTLPLITYRLLRSPSGEKALGLVYAVNTLGSIIGVVVAVHLLLEWAGMRGALLVGALIDVALGIVLLLALRARGASWRFPAEGAIAVGIVVAMAIVFNPDPRRSASGVFRTGVPVLTSGDMLAFHRDGKTATVDVIENQQGVRVIRTNGKPDASLAMKGQAPPTQDEYTMTLLAVLPMGHRPQATSAAVVGFGSGMSSALLLASPQIRRVDTIEIEPAMVEGARLFRPFVEAAYTDPRSRIVIDDAKSYFARGKERYDIIVSEPSNPWVSGVASLFTEEFYQRLSGYLNDGGVLCQWLHTYEMDAPTLASIMSALAKTFPNYAVYTSIDTDIIVVARKGSQPAGRFDARITALPALQPMLGKLKLGDARLIDRRLIGTSEGLAPFFASYRIPANSDFYPVVDQRASRTRFTLERVTELKDLQAVPVPMLEMVGGAPPPAAAPIDAHLVTWLDASTDQAWAMHRAIIRGDGPRLRRPLTDNRDLSGELVRSWALCQSDLSFNEALPSLVTVAEFVNPRLHPQHAGAIWSALADSPCGRRLTRQERAWLELFAAIGRRDAEAMVAFSAQVLEGTRGVKNPASELAVLAGVTGALCGGDQKGARELLEQAVEHWMRPGSHNAAIRFLEGLTQAPPGTRTGACAARG